MSDPQILVVGGADTGRAPMALVLLQRMLGAQRRDWTVVSAGVVGHDEAPAEVEARAAMAVLGLDLTEHRARSLTSDQIEAASLVIAIDSGIARVVRDRFPTAPTYTLGELAGRARDVPDPFRMPVSAWLQYARELEDLLRAGLPRMGQILDGTPLTPAPSPAPLEQSDPGIRTGSDLTGRGDGVPMRTSSPVKAEARLPEGPSAGPVSANHAALVHRACGMLDLLAEAPAVIVWSAAREQLAADLAILAEPESPGDLAQPYAQLVRAMLDLVSDPPSATQAHAMHEAVARLAAPISAEALSALAASLSQLRGSS